MMRKDSKELTYSIFKRHVFNLRASENATNPSLPILLYRKLVQGTYDVDMVT